MGILDIFRSPKKKEARDVLREKNDLETLKQLEQEEERLRWAIKINPNKAKVEEAEEELEKLQAMGVDTLKDYLKRKKDEKRMEGKKRGVQEEILKEIIKILKKHDLKGANQDTARNQLDIQEAIVAINKFVEVEGIAKHKLEDCDLLQERQERQLREKVEAIAKNDEYRFKVCFQILKISRGNIESMAEHIMNFYGFSLITKSGALHKSIASIPAAA